MSKLTPDYPCHTIFDLSGSNMQLHLHGPNPDVVTQGHLIRYDRQYVGEPLNGHDASMAAHNAEAMGFRKIVK